MGKKILVIKLGAKGDVVRTLSILPALGERYPGCEITWVTKGNIVDLFERDERIKRVVAVENTGDLGEFDILYNFDIEDEACDLAEKMKAEEKHGFYKDGDYAAAFDLGGEYYLSTIFDDSLKKSNRKTYQKMMFDAACLEWKGQKAEVKLEKEDREFGKKFLEESGLEGKRIIGIHMGAGPRWPSKAWHEERVEEFIKLAKERGFEVLLFGGPDEVGKHEALAEKLRDGGIEIYRNDIKNTNREFYSLVDLCEFVVCSDSYALHVALGLGKKTVGMFFVTSPWEVYDYGLLKKVVAPGLAEFFPEKMDQYDEELVRSISAQEVMDELESFENE